MKVGVIGGGTMGVSLAALFLARGFDVHVVTRRVGEIDKISEKIKTFAAKIGQTQKAQLLVTDSYDALDEVELVIEAVEENLQTKKKILREVQQRCPTAFIYTNTSSLSVSELATGLEKPQNFAGMHFFNPAHKMQLVEIVKTNTTSQKTVENASEFVKSLGKTSVIVTDSPGFVVNRLLMPFLLDAVKLRDAGIASEKDIDTAIKFGLNHPMGPFELLDLIGLDVFLSILKQLELEPPASVVKMVQEGKLGRKTKQGFYKY